MKGFLKEFWKKNWVLVVVMLFVVGMYSGVVAFLVGEERAEIENAILLVNAPAEVVEGRVEKIVTVSEYDFATGTEQTHGTAYLCSGTVWPVPDNQLVTVTKWLKFYAPNRGCN